MFALYVHRVAGVTVEAGTYETPIEAHAARLTYVAAAKCNGFRVRRGQVTTFLRNGPVRLEAWVERCEGNHD